MPEIQVEDEYEVREDERMARDVEALHDESLRGGSPHDGTLDDEALHGGSHRDGTLDDEALHGGSHRDGTLDDEALRDGSRHDGTLDDEALHGGTLDDEALHDGNHEALHGGILHGGVLDDGALDDGALRGWVWACIACSMTRYGLADHKCGMPGSVESGTRLFRWDRAGP